jgi:hypothetical protein
VEYCIPGCCTSWRDTGTGESTVTVSACASVGEKSDVCGAEDAVFGTDTVEEVDDFGENIYTTYSGLSACSSSALSPVWTSVGG